MIYCEEYRELEFFGAKEDATRFGGLLGEKTSYRLKK
jgi:hypothetical protein